MSQNIGRSVSRHCDFVNTARVFTITLYYKQHKNNHNNTAINIRNIVITNTIIIKYTLYSEKQQRVLITAVWKT